MGARTNVAENRVEVWCDTCKSPAPPVEEIRKAFGLNRMGWECHGGTHICPGCREQL